MAGSITPGVTFQAGQSYTATQFNSAFTDATLSGITRADMASTTRPVTVSASAPTSPQNGELWFDTGTRNLMLYDTTLVDWVSLGPQPQLILTAQSTIASNDVVVFDTGAASSVETTTTALAQSVAGIARGAASSSESVPVQFIGIGAVNCTSAAVAIGDRLVTSTTAGQARTATAGEGGHFAIALSSKSGGGEGTVTCSLVPQQSYVPKSSSASFATYSMTATLTNSTWYDFPNAALGAVTAPTDGGSSSMKVSATSTRAGQVATLTIIGLDIRTNDVNDFFKGFRVLLRDSIGNETVVAGSTTKGAAFSDADGEQEYHACGAIVYRITSILVGVSVQGASITFTIPTADSYSIRPQFQASNAGATSYAITNVTTATLLAVLS